MPDRRRAQTEPPDLDIGQDLAFQERTWTVQRVGWIVMLVLVAAAIAGLFSGGPLSRSEATDPAALIAVEYERFARYTAPTTLRLRLQPSSTGRDTVTVRMSRPLAENLDIQHVRPEPDRMLAAPDGMHFEFAVAEPGGPAEIVFSVKPQSVGPLRGEIGLVGHEPARLSQFVYP